MELLKKLTEEHGPSGDEGKIREIIKKEIKPYVDELYRDKFGNLVARKKGKGTSVLLAAHMDEIGVMVKSIDVDGKVFISPVGGIEPVVLLGEKVKIVTNTGKIVYGVLTCKEIQDGAELAALPAMEDVYADVGMCAKDVKKSGIAPGNYAYLMKGYMEMANGNVVSGKALDDRVGCYILLELAKKLKKSNSEIYYVFTVQEEIGLYGAKTSLYSIDPEYAIVVDVTEADDGRMHEGHGKCLGHGPVIVYKDAEMITNKCINDWLIKAAKKLKIEVQPDVGNFGTTDALSVSVSKGGIPCTAVGVPVRNIHSTTSVANKNDIKDAIKIIHEVLKNPPKVCL